MKANADYVPAIALVVVLLSSSNVPSAGQGLDTTDGATQGATVATKSLEELYANSEAYKTAWRAGPRAACSSAGTSKANLCSASVSQEQQQVLELAASPLYYDSRITTYTGVPIISTPKDQGSCSTCVAFVVTAALQTALAAGLQEPVTGISFSEQQLFFCSEERGSAVTRSCSSPWGIHSALDTIDRLQRVGKFLTTEACLPYAPDSDSGSRCAATCNTTDPRLKEGVFQFTPLGSMLEMMSHIRQHGAVITAMDEMSDMRAWFAKNPKGVYMDHNDTQRISGHAVLLIGYDLPSRYWIAKNSWGTKFADGGFFKIAFGAAGIGSIDYSWGVWFEPYNKPVLNMQLQKLPASGASPGDCYTYTTKAGDYPSGLAAALGISTQAFLRSNTDVIRSLDESIVGKHLKFCNLPTSTILRIQGPNNNNQEQLEALLQLHLGESRCKIPSWTEANGKRLGFCIIGRFAGITCDSNGHVVKIHLNMVGCPIYRGKDLARLPYLEELSLSGASGALDEDYGLLAKLVNLTMTNGFVKGTIPASLARLPNIHVINFSYNMLTGTLPSELGSLKTLKTLLATSNKLSGLLPPSWAKLSSLEVLGLGNNSLVGTIPPDWFVGMHGLHELYLWSNNLSGPLPPTIGRLQALTRLRLQVNKLSGSLPVELGQLSNLVDLSVARNQLKGPIPSSLSKLTRLFDLYLSYNTLSGTLDPSWGMTMKNLSVLWLDHNYLTGGLPGTWSQLPLTSVRLSGNKFTGLLPSSWSLMPLESLDLSDNQLHGPLPLSYAALGPTLTVLYLNNNQLTSTLPPSYNKLEHLKELLLSRNNFSGSLPARWAGMAALQILALQGNQLSGTLPSEWGALSHLENVLLSNNSIKGNIPSSWGQLPKLYVLLLGGNRLQGTLPTWKSHASKEVLILELWGNKGLVGCLPADWKGQAGILDPKGSVFLLADAPQLGLTINTTIAKALIGTGITGMCGAR